MPVMEVKKRARRKKPEPPKPEQVFPAAKSLLDQFSEFMGVQGQRAESSSGIKAREAYTTNLKAIADAGVSMHQMPAFLAYTWAGRDRGHYDRQMFQTDKHTANLDALTVSKIAVSNTASSVAELGMVGMFLDWFNKLVNIDEQPAWLAKILRSDTYGEGILALATMFIAKASGITLDEEGLAVVVKTIEKVKKA